MDLDYYWIKDTIKETYRLYYNLFYVDTLIAELSYDYNSNYWICNININNNKTLINYKNDDVQNIKNKIEIIVINEINSVNEYFSKENK